MEPVAEDRRAWGRTGAERDPQPAARHAGVGLARFGLLARGVVYGVIGVLAIEVATGSGGRTTNQQGALQTVAGQPFGDVLLAALMLGLLGYAGWRLKRAVVGHGTRERDSKIDRIAAAGSGAVYAGLAVVALKILLGSGTGSGAPKRTTAGVLGWPGGPVLVAIGGCVLIAMALFQGYRSVTRTFVEEADTGHMTVTVKRAYVTVGVVGHAARMVVFGLTGYGLLTAAIEYDPQRAIGLDGALRDLARSSEGPLLLGSVAAGLLCFACYSAFDARYRKI